METAGLALSSFLNSNPGDFSVPQLDALATDLLARSKDALPSAGRISSSSMSAGEISSKWNELQSRILADETAVAACRSDADRMLPGRTTLPVHC